MNQNELLRQRKIREFEELFGMTSEEFKRKFYNGALDDRNEYYEWIRLIGVSNE